MKILMLLCCCLPTLARQASNPPSPGPTKATEKDQHVRGNKPAGGEKNGTVAQPGATVLNQNTSQTKADSTEQQSTKRQHAAPAKNLSEDRATGLSNVLVTIFTGCLVLLAGLQFWAMHRQAGYMRDGLNLTRQSADAARDSALAAQHTVEIMRLEQRAWVGTSGVRPPKLQPGKPVRTLVHVKNSGRTLARNVTIDAYAECIWELKRSYSAGSSSEPDVILYPGANLFLPVSTPKALSMQEFDGIKSGRMRLYVWGQIQYRLVDSTIHHRSQFSFIYSYELNRFEACAGFNEAT